MRLTLRNDLPFVNVQITYRGASADVSDVLIDTGSASTLFSADAVARIGIVPEPSDRLRTLRGVGGVEIVFSRRVDGLRVNGQGVGQFEIEVGGMDYGFSINGILGMDFLRRTGAIIDLGALEIRFPTTA